jgi:hypothetical protein
MNKLGSFKKRICREWRTLSGLRGKRCSGSRQKKRRERKNRGRLRKRQ